MRVVLDKSTNETLGFPDEMSNDAVSAAVASRKGGRPFSDINPSFYETTVMPAMKEAKATGNNEILYAARRKQLDVDPFTSSISAGPFGLFASKDPAIVKEREARREIEPTKAFLGDLTMQTAEILAVGGVTGPIIAPIAERVGYVALKQLPMATRLTRVGSGKILQTSVGKITYDVGHGLVSNSALGVMYNGISSAAKEGKAYFDQPDDVIEKKYPDMVRIGKEMAHGLGWGAFAIGAPFARTAVGITTGSMAVGGTAKLMALAEGASETDANMSAFVMMAVHAVGTTTHSLAERKQIISDVKDSIGYYIKAKNSVTGNNSLNEVLGDQFVYKTGKDLLRQKYEAQLEYYDAKAREQRKDIATEELYVKERVELERQLAELESDGGPAILDKIASSKTDTQELVNRIAERVVKADVKKGEVAVEKEVVKTSEAVETIETPTKVTRAFAKAKERYSEELKDFGNVDYSEIQIADQMDRSFQLLKTDKALAKKITYNRAEVPEGMTREAISIAYAEEALASGNNAEFAKATIARSLRQTERGQEIVMERALNMHDVGTVVKKIVDSKIQEIGAKKIKLSTSDKNVSNKKSGLEELKKEKSKVKEVLKEQKIDFVELEKIIDGLVC